MVPEQLKKIRKIRKSKKIRPLEEALQIVQGEGAREVGIAKALAHAEEEWVTAALAAVFAVAKQREHFTADHVWMYGDGLPPPREPRAMGSVMRIADKAGWISPTQDHWLSKRPSCHRRPLRVWESNLKKGK